MSGKFGDLTEEQRTSLTEFQAKIMEREMEEGEAEVQAKMFECFGGMEYCAWRFLKARDFSVEKTFDMARQKKKPFFLFLFLFPCENHSGDFLISPPLD